MTKQKKKMGRPPIEIDKVKFESLCKIFCTLTEIAGVFNCSEDTIENWCKKIYGETFSECFKIFSANGKMSLRRMQYQRAVKDGNVAMLIFLGKQYLGQKENPETDDLKESLDKLDEYLGNLPK